MQRTVCKTSPFGETAAYKAGLLVSRPASISLLLLNSCGLLNEPGNPEHRLSDRGSKYHDGKSIPFVVNKRCKKDALQLLTFKQKQEIICRVAFGIDCC